LLHKIVIKFFLTQLHFQPEDFKLH